jgi:hypothetical protein
MGGSTFGLSIGRTQKVTALAAADDISLNPIISPGATTPPVPVAPDISRANSPQQTKSPDVPKQDVAQTIEYRQTIRSRQEPCAADGGQPCGGILSGTCISRHFSEFSFPITLLDCSFNFEIKMLCSNGLLQYCDTDVL